MTLRADRCVVWPACSCLWFSYSEGSTIWKVIEDCMKIKTSVSLWEIYDGWGEEGKDSLEQAVPGRSSFWRCLLCFRKKCGTWSAERLGWVLDVTGAGPGAARPTLGNPPAPLLLPRVQSTSFVDQEALKGIWVSLLYLKNESHGHGVISMMSLLTLWKRGTYLRKRH